MIEVWLLFAFSALLTVGAAIKLSEYGDVIAARTGLGGMFVGTLLLAGATSLPELLTTINSINQDVPDLAAGNIFGSCMFNMFMLAILDLLTRQSRILRRVTLNHALSAGMAVLIGSLAIVFILADVDFRIGWVGIDSLVLMAIYIGGIRLLNDSPAVAVEPELTMEQAATMPSLRVALIGFAVATGVLLVIMPALVRSSTGIAVSLGVSTGFIGAALVAFITSLPEVVTTISAARIRAYDLAIGNLFGSNLFNIFALGITDLFYTQGRFLGDIDPTMTLAAILGVTLTAMGLVGNVARIEKRFFFIEIDGLVIAVTYLLGMTLLYQRGLVL
jgi:cation:H+ antiporter